jgi:hypothetical protein
VRTSRRRIGGQGLLRADETVRNGLIAVGVAATVSGAPSTIYALLTGDSVLTATRAAGTLLGRPSVARGLVAHVGLSLSWGAVLARVLPARHRAALGILAGAAIAALDLDVVGRRFPAIRALPQLPQWADHLVFGAVLGGVLDARSVSPPAGRPPQPR